MDGIKVIKEKFVPLILEYMDRSCRYTYNHFIKIVSTEVEESVLGNNEYADYIKAGVSKDAQIKIKYQVLTRDKGENINKDAKNKDGILEVNFYLPIPIHGLFIIDGKVRAPLNYVDNAKCCIRYGDASLAINPNLSLYFERNTVNYPDPTDDEPYRRVDVPISEFHKIPHEYLKLSEQEGRRLMLQYRNKIDKVPTELTLDLYEKLRERPQLSRDNIAFKQVISVYDALYYHLIQPSTKHSINQKASHQFNKHWKYYPSSLQTAMNQFFKGQSDYLVGVSHMTNTNPATYKTLSNKLILEKYARGASMGIIRPTDYNESLSLLVDPSMTPDSQNVNRINEMNKAIEYDGFNTYVHVIDLRTKEETKLELLEYLTTPIVSSLEVDQKTKTLRPLKDKSDTYVVRWCNDRSMHFDDHMMKDKDVHYADTPSDDRLSISTRMIPNLNFSDSVRTSMGSRMLNQAIEIANPEAPIVGTGHKDFKDLSLFIKSPVSGTVKEIRDDEIIISSIKDNKEVETAVRIPENMNATYNIDVSFKLNCKVGDKVYSDDILVRPLGVANDGSPMLGVNAFVAFANYKGYTYEDGVVISQSFARKLTHTYIVDVESLIYDFDKLNGITPLGTRLKSKDVIASITRMKSPSAQVKGIIDIFMPEESQTDMDYPAPVVCPNNIYESYLVDVNYAIGGAVNDAAKRLLDDYRDGTKRVELPFEYHYNRLPKAEKEPDEKWALKVTYRLVVRAEAVVGDKISNRYGSKGVITKIIPDNEMWRTKDGKILDCIMNPFAVISRKNVSQTMEAGLSVLADRVWNERVKDHLDDLTSVRKTLDHFRMDHYKDMGDKELLATLTKDGRLYYITGCYGSITPKQISEFLEEFGTDGRTVLYKADGNPLRQPVVCGYQYMIKLMFLVSYMNKVTSDAFDMDESMILGMGAEKDAGQSLEEMIFWGLQSHGALKAIDEFRSNAGRNSELWLRAHCLAAGLDLSIQSEDESK